VYRRRDSAIPSKEDHGVKEERHNEGWDIDASELALNGVEEEMMREVLRPGFDGLL